MSEDQKKQIQQHLWNIANELRGKMDADEFKDYMLGFIFYKYLSEKMYLFANEQLVEDNLKYEELIEGTEQGDEYIELLQQEALEALGYFLKPSQLFSTLANKGASKAEEGDSSFILEELTQVLNYIEQSTMGTESEDDFNKLFEDLDLTSTKLGRTEKAKNDLIVKVLGHLDRIDFKLEDSESDVLGDAYEYLIGQFASGAGKKAGEFYTPQEVSTILARLVTTGKKRLKSVYDPTCGSGSLLLRVAKEVEEVGHFYGQEMNRTTYNLARMNMILHDVHFAHFDIRQEDTLEHPQHLDHQFEAVVANPPFSAKWSASSLHMTDDRFSQYGKLAPSSKADFAFVQHMLYQLHENGTMACVLPHGVLFRGAAEGHIRKYLIEDRNWLDAVIGLPANIFYGTSIPTSILVFKKCKEHPEQVLFIDASQHFEKAKNQNYLRPQDIDKIIETYRNYNAGNYSPPSQGGVLEEGGGQSPTESVGVAEGRGGQTPLGEGEARGQGFVVEEKYACIATLAEIKENDYNLNIPRYVDTFEEEEPIDLQLVSKELGDLEEQMTAIDQKIASYCNELGIDSPVKF